MLGHDDSLKRKSVFGRIRLTRNSQAAKTHLDLDDLWWSLVTRTPLREKRRALKAVFQGGMSLWLSAI